MARFIDEALNVQFVPIAPNLLPTAEELSAGSSLFRLAPPWAMEDFAFQVVTGHRRPNRAAMSSVVVFPFLDRVERSAARWRRVASGWWRERVVAGWEHLRYGACTTDGDDW